MASTRKSEPLAPEEPAKKPTPRYIIVNLLKTAMSELQTLHDDPVEAMVVRQQYGTIYHELDECIKLLHKLDRLQEIRQLPCYVREGGRIRKMNVNELLASLDNDEFDGI